MKDIKGKVDIDTSQLNSAFASLNKFKSTFESMFGKKIKPEIDDSAIKSGAKNIQSEMDDAGKKSGQKFNDSFSSRVKEISIGTLLSNAISGAFSAISNSVSQATTSFLEFDKQILNIGTLGVKNFEEFTGLINELSTKTPETAQALAAAAYQAISAGIQGTNEEITAFVEQASQVAVAGLSTTEAAVNGLTSVMNAYKLGVGDAGGVSDTFFTAIKLGKTTFDELNASLSQVVPNASAAGISFEEVAAAISQMTALGVPTAQATTKLNQAIIALQKPSKETEAVMARLGITSANLGDKLKSDGLISVLQQIEVEAKNTGQSFNQIFGSQEAAAAAFLLTGENAQRTNEILKQFGKDDKAGAAADAFEIASQSIGNSLTLITNNIQAKLNEIFNKLKPLVKPILEVLTFIIKNIEAFLPILAVLGVAVYSLVAPLVAVKIATIAWNTTLLANPIFQVIAGIAALVAAFVLLYNNSEVVRKVVDKVWEAFKIFIDFIWNNAVETFKVLGEVIWEAIKFWANWLNPIGLVYNAFKFFIPIIEELIDKYLPGLGDAIKSLIRPFVDAYNAVAKFLGFANEGGKKEIKGPTINTNAYDSVVDKVEVGEQKKQDAIKTTSNVVKTENKKQEDSYNSLVPKLVQLALAGKQASESYNTIFNKAVETKTTELENKSIQDDINKSLTNQVLLRTKLFDSQSQIQKLLVDEYKNIDNTEFNKLVDIYIKLNNETLLRQANETIVNEKIKERIALLNEENKSATQKLNELFGKLNVDTDLPKIQLIDDSQLEKIDAYAELLNELRDNATGVFSAMTGIGEETANSLLETSETFGNVLGTLLANGNNFFESLGNAALASLIELAQKQIMIYVPEIMAAFMSLLGPFGIPAALLAIGTIQGLLTAARSSIGAETGYMDGVKQAGKPGKSDTMPIWINPREVILTEQMRDRQSDMLRAWFSSGIEPDVYYRRKFESENKNNNNSNSYNNKISINTTYEHKFKDIKWSGSNFVSGIDKIKRKEMIRR